VLEPRRSLGLCRSDRRPDGTLSWLLSQGVWRHGGAFRLGHAPAASSRPITLCQCTCSGYETSPGLRHDRALPWPGRMDRYADWVSPVAEAMRRGCLHLGGPITARLPAVILSQFSGVYDVAFRPFELRRGHVILSGVYDAPEACGTRLTCVCPLSLPLLSSQPRPEPHVRDMSQKQNPCSTWAYSKWT
jgi:hypothetical protein